MPNLVIEYYQCFVISNIKEKHPPYMVISVLGRLSSLIIHPFVTFHLAIKDLQLILTVQFRRLLCPCT